MPSSALGAAFRQLPVREAWDAFGEANGAGWLLCQRVVRVEKYVRTPPGKPLPRIHRIGCILLVAPVFFPREIWVSGPTDWSDNTVTGNTYDAATGEGRRI